MKAVNTTELRNNLPKYLHLVEKGTEILITSHGKVVARISPPIDVKQQAQNKLKLLRKTCKVGDVISPIEDNWDVSK